MRSEEILERAAWLVKSQRDRITLQEELQKVFQLDWNEDVLANAPDWVKPVKDPQPFNSMQWLVDVMAHDEPQYSIEIPDEAMPQRMDVPQMPMGGMMGGEGVGGIGSNVGGMGMDAEMGGMLSAQGVPEEKEDSGAQELADTLEHVLKEVYRQNDRRSATSLQRDELYAAFVNGMIVDKTADLRLTGKRWGQYVEKHRGASPFVTRSVNPAHVCFEHNEYGVSEVFHRYLRPLKEIVRLYGGNVLGLSNVKANEADGHVLFCEYWTKEITAKWVEKIYYNGDADDRYISPTEYVGSAYMLEAPKENTLDFIPYAIKIARGSSIFTRTNMVYPHLYAGHKSKLFLRQNLFLTVASTLAFMLVNPQAVQETDDLSNTISMDFSRPAVHGIRKGDKITPMQMNMTRDFYDVMTMIGQKVEESTVSKVVAGQSPGGVTAASGINLLIGGGKLTVSGVQSALGEVRSGAAEHVFDYLRAFPTFAEAEESPQLEMYLGGAFKHLDPASFPDRMDISVKFQAFLPQDKALAMQTFLTPVMQGLLSSDFLYQQIGVNDVVTLRKQIDEDKDRALADQQFQQQLQPPDPNAQAASGANGMGGDNPASQAEADAAAAQPSGALEEQVVGQPTGNPMEAASNPANALNDIFNSMQNPMAGG